MASTVVSMAERPELRPEIGRLHGAAWPTFMLHSPVSDRYWDALFSVFARFQFVLCDEQGVVIAAGHSIPLVWDGTIAGLPAGWDAALEQGVRDQQQGRPPTALSALAAIVDPQVQGQGLSRSVIQAMREIAAAHGLSDLIAPVRPSFKSRYPLTPIERYMRWQQPDNPGLPFDPWLRVHARLGAEILAAAPQSMTIPGTLAEWQRWTGLHFPESGLYVAPGALQPIEIDCERDLGRYVEPNVWMRHRVLNER
jgi:GNAT superfamily N-acetyltransferase